MWNKGQTSPGVQGGIGVQKVTINSRTFFGGGRGKP